MLAAVVLVGGLCVVPAAAQSGTPVGGFGGGAVFDANVAAYPAPSGTDANRPSGPAGVAKDPNRPAVGLGGGADPNKPPAGVAGVGFDPNQILRMMASLPPRDANMDRYWLDPNQLTLKDALGATDEEWLALFPKIKKVQKLQAQLHVRWETPSADAAMAPSPAMVPSPGVAPVVAEPSELQQAAAALAKVLADKGAGDSDIKTALQTFIQARAKLKADLEKAQKELKELLTVRQEAILKQKSILD